MIERIRAADMYSTFAVATKLNELIEYLNRLEERGHSEAADECSARDDGHDRATGLLDRLRACGAVAVIGCQAVDVRVPLEVWREIETAPAEGTGAVA